MCRPSMYYCSSIFSCQCHVIDIQEEAITFWKKKYIRIIFKFLSLYRDWIQHNDCNLQHNGDFMSKQKYAFSSSFITV